MRELQVMMVATDLQVSMEPMETQDVMARREIVVQSVAQVAKEIRVLLTTLAT